MTHVPTEAKNAALDFLNPEIRKNDKLYAKACKLIDTEFNRYSRVSILCESNEDLASLLASFNIDIGEREVIISDGRVRGLDSWRVKRDKTLFSSQSFSSTEERLAKKEKDLAYSRILRSLYNG